MSFPRYPAYKDSGVEWFSQIPKHWGVRRLKALVDPDRSITYGIVQAGPEVADGVPYVRPADMTDEGGVSNPERILRTSNEIAESYRRSAIRAGDLVVSIGPSFGKVMIVPEWLDGANLTQGTARVAVASADPYFVFWALRGPSSFSQWESSVGGATFRALNLGPLAETICPEPPRSEQKAIGNFLNEETAKIDALVAEQEQLITLLKEKRKAVISHAVTKGLDPSVPMKDSGVEWLGAIPAHWAVGKCGFYIRILSGFAFPSSGFSQDETNYRLLRGANVGVSRLKWDDTVFWERLEGDGLDDYEMSEGDLVIGMDRPLISEGMRVAKITAEDLPSLLLQRVASLKVGSKLHADYLHHLLSSEMFIAHFSPETTGVSVPHISPDQINNFVIPVPAIDEQRAIVQHLGNLATSYSGLINEAVLSIELLRERRSALISAAVTGQIDVRGLSPAQEQAV